MHIRKSTLAVFITSTIMISGCGDDSGPTSGSPAPGLSATQLGPMALTADGANSATQFTSVRQILGNPGGFMGQEVRLQGRATEQIDNVRFLFTDGTGEIRIQFEPTGPFPSLDVGIEIVGTAASGTGGIAVKIDVSSFETLGAFSCDDVLEVRGRFTDPGYSFGNVVGYYLSFIGVPPGEKMVEMDWDDGNIEKLPVGPGTLRGDGLFDLEGVVAHEYHNVKGEDRKRVAARLMIKGREDFCARVVHVTVTPGEGPGSAGGGTISVSVDEGDTIESGSTFSVRGKVYNKSTGTADVAIVFQTPERSKLIPESVSRCEVLDEELVECFIKDVAPGDKYTRVVQYRGPTVSKSLQITGHVALVSGNFKPVAMYRLTVKP